MDIADVARASGLKPSTLRYYEQKGLIRSAGRHGLRRYYDTTVLERLALINLGRYVGLSLEEIRHMLLPNGVDVDRALLRQKTAEMDKQIATMQAIREGLHHAANCPAPNHLACPTFQRLLKLAGKRLKPQQSKL
ncbi:MULTISPECIES: helix-turn-helix domain-containing protein [unclassified Pseudoalteromonas]|uniref:helix-turn-helix domain-containing protein n=1 Tax=unclassified Pseudoalteromonas TaxID=194690 RepID=UPI0020969983|nr:helix-turn-helix domain-containing protein [Pseudoalteromonas sp. XMcav2-N]MCO7187022.1 helix-turn-helix domain-containing protein [Pseudoalteromonas sp. XMcav2-N]